MNMASHGYSALPTAMADFIHSALRAEQIAVGRGHVALPEDDFSPMPVVERSPNQMDVLICHATDSEGRKLEFAFHRNEIYNALSAIIKSRLEIAREEAKSAERTKNQER